MSASFVCFPFVDLSNQVRKIALIDDFVVDHSHQKLLDRTIAQSIDNAAHRFRQICELEMI